MTALDTIIARVVVIVRGIAMAEIVVQVIIWHSFYLASPWRLWAPIAALAWGTTTMAYLWRRRPSPPLVSPRLAYILATDDAPDRPTLSAQETRTLRLYATGLPIKSVARRLGIGEETAKQYVRRVREKYAQAAVQRLPRSTCTIVPSRTGISLYRPSYGTPPPSRGNRRYPSSATRTRKSK